MSVTGIHFLKLYLNHFEGPTDICNGFMWQGWVAGGVYLMDHLVPGHNFLGSQGALQVEIKFKLCWHSLWLFTNCVFGEEEYVPMYAAAAAKSLQSSPTLCNPVDGSPPGSPVPGILQARTLEWVAIAFSNAWKWKGKVKSLSRVWLFETPWTVAHQAPPSTGFSRQEYWSGVPLPSLMCLCVLVQ